MFIEQQTRLHTDKQHRQLQKLSDTRWACQSMQCATPMMLFLLHCLSICDGIKAVETKGLLLQVKSFRFILCLIIFDRLLSYAKGLSDVLQAPQLDLAGRLILFQVQ